MLHARSHMNMNAESLSPSQNIISYISQEGGELYLSEAPQKWSSVEQGWVTFST